MIDSFLTVVLTSAAVSALLSGLAITLFKDLLSERMKAAIKAEYDEKLENHKAQLQAANDRELETLKVKLKAEADVEQERLKSQLQITAAQENTTFTRLHERRVEAMEVTFNHLLPVRDAVGQYIQMYQPVGGPTDKEMLEQVSKRYGAFKAVFVQKQLFLPRHVAEALEKLDAKFLEVTNQFTSVVKADPRNPKPLLWVQLVEQFRTDIDLAIEELLEDMRVALGDKKPQ